MIWFYLSFFSVSVKAASITSDAEWVSTVIPGSEWKQKYDKCEGERKSLAQLIENCDTIPKGTSTFMISLKLK